MLNTTNFVQANQTSKKLKEIVKKANGSELLSQEEVTFLMQNIETPFLLFSTISKSNWNKDWNCPAVHWDKWYAVLAMGQFNSWLKSGATGLFTCSNRLDGFYKYIVLRDGKFFLGPYNQPLGMSGYSEIPFGSHNSIVRGLDLKETDVVGGGFVYIQDKVIKIYGESHEYKKPPDSFTQKMSQKLQEAFGKPVKTE